MYVCMCMYVCMYVCVVTDFLREGRSAVSLDGSRVGADRVDAVPA